SNEGNVVDLVQAFRKPPGDFPCRELPRLNSSVTQPASPDRPVPRRCAESAESASPIGRKRDRIGNWRRRASSAHPSGVCPPGSSTQASGFLPGKAPYEHEPPPATCGECSPSTASARASWKRQVSARLLSGS